MPLPRMRTINAAAEHYKNLDSETGITKNMIRSLVKSGELSEGVVLAGSKYLVSLDVLDNYFAKGSIKSANDLGNTVVSYHGIRRIQTLK